MAVSQAELGVVAPGEEVIGVSRGLVDLEQGLGVDWETHLVI